MSEVEIKGAVIREMTKALKRLGAKSDPLGVACGHGETHDDERVLTGLREWNEVGRDDRIGRESS